MDEEPRNFVAWMDENIPVEYTSAKDKAAAFNNLSRADIFLGRVMNRQYWGFLRYVNDLTTVGVAFVKEKPYYGFAKYNFPSLIWKMGSTRAKRAKQGSVAAKVSPVVHDSKRRIIVDYLPLVERVFEKDKMAGGAMMKAFELEAEELEFLV